MGFLTSLFGGSGNTVITMVLALGIVLLLIILGVWALKLLFNATGNVGRARNKRLAIIDSAPIDPKRQLVLIRRDNVEHLLVVGGPQDLLVETNIPAPAEIAQNKRPKRRSGGNNPAPAATTVATAAVAVPLAAAAQPSKEATALSDAPSVITPSSEPIDVQPTVNTDPTEPTARRSSSLRHTGLLRTSSRVEPQLTTEPSSAETENPPVDNTDSDTNDDEIDQNISPDAVEAAPKETDSDEKSAENSEEDQKQDDVRT